MKLLPSREPNRLPPLRRSSCALVAAGLVSLLVACGNGDSAPEERPGGAPLASGELRCVSPVGESADFSLFEWEGVLPEGGYFQVAIYMHNDGTPLGPVRRSPELESNSWAPRDGDVQRFPDELFWRVFAVDASATTVARGSAVAKR